MSEDNAMYYLQTENGDIVTGSPNLQGCINGLIVMSERYNYDKISKKRNNRYLIPGFDRNPIEVGIGLRN